MKYVPNALSVLRIVLAVSLLWFAPLSIPFFVIYIACGLTDVADGFIARRFNVSSELGSKLDSIGDVVLTFVVLSMLLPLVNVPIVILAWILLIVLVRIVAMSISYTRSGKALLLHTTSNRVFALLLFAYPLIFTFYDSMSIPLVLCVLASAAAIEELAIMITAPKIDPNISSYIAMIEEVETPLSK